MSQVELSKVTKNYDHDLVIEDINVSLEKNDFACIIGPNGVGKSTVLKIAAGLINPDKGDTKLPKSFSYMPQGLSLLPWKTVRDNLLLPLNLSGNKPEKKVDKLLKGFGLIDYANKYPNQLSGGMQQKLAILRAVITNPELIFLDEPFSSLDAITRRQMQNWILDFWRQKQLTILMVTHDIREAIILSNKIYVMSGRPGKIVKVYDNFNKTAANVSKLEDKLEKLLI